MTRDDARAFVVANAAAGSAPALTEAEVEMCLDDARLKDVFGLAPGDFGYTETIWAARAVVNAIDLKLAKAASKTDLTVDGAQILASQRTANLTALRARWASRLILGPR